MYSRLIRLLSVVIVAAALPLAFNATPAVAACAARSRPDMSTASALAKSCRKSIRVESAQTSTTSVSANSNGSFTATEWAVPHQAQKPDGTWVPVNTKLHVNVDGSVSPIASPAPVTLSGGGNNVLARQVSNKQELIWSWPAGVLPKPSLEGDVATYKDVFRGVDLAVTVDETGFSEVLVVRSASAAQNMTQIRFDLSGTGLSAAGFAGTASSLAQAVTPKCGSPGISVGGFVR